MKTIIQVVGKCIYAFLFLTFLIIPISLTNTEEKVKSNFDNRELVEFPEIGEMDFEEKIENYLHDRIGLRDELITGYQLVNDNIIGELYHPIYTYGQDGYVFFKMHDNIEYNEYHDIFVDAVVKMNEYCNARGIHFYFLFDPEKISVYRRYLPVGVNYNDKWVDTLIHNLEERGVKCVNNTAILTEKSQTEQVYNIKYDAGHWNDLGCFYGTNNLWRTIHEDYPEVTEYSLDEFNISYGIGTYLANSRYPVYETIPIFKYKKHWEDITDHYSTICIDERYPYFQYYINRDKKAKKYPKILAFHGSYYNRGPQFFVARASEYVGVHDYQNILNLDYYINIFQPNIVIFEAAEYTFKEQYFDSRRMDELDYNPLNDKAIDISKDQIGEEILFSISEDGFSTIYLNQEIPSAQYVYLVTQERQFDLQKNNYGLYYTGIPKDVDFSNAKICYEDYNGKKHLIEVREKKAERFVKKPILSKGVTYENSKKRYTITTDIKGNKFNAIQLQLYDAISGEYAEDIFSIDAEETVSGCFIHVKETGWYRLRLKANSNKQDEYIDLYANLCKGERYFYSFGISLVSPKKIIIDHFEIAGPSLWQLREIELFDHISGSAHIRKESNIYTYSTIEENNVFNSVMLQLRNEVDGNLIEPITVTRRTGKHEGLYLHKDKSGAYILRLRANSNIKDEYIEKEVILREGMLYKYSFDISEFDEKKVTISSPSFISVGDD